MSKIYLAPMAGVTDAVFRALCVEQGCDFVTTEMVSAKAMSYDNENTKGLLAELDCQKAGGNTSGFSVQIFGSEPELLARMAAKIEREYANVDVIDINMGCPAPKIVRNGEGSALMKDPKLAGQIVRAVSRAVSLPVTVKIRKGFDENSVNAVEIAKIAEDNGAAALTVHGRTRTQFYSGQADWEIIAWVKEALSIPVVGNGDVVDGVSAKKMFEQTKCDAVMIGRAALGNPWIFREVKYFLETGQTLLPPTAEEKFETALRHAKMLVESKGERTGLLEMRKHIAWYLKGVSGAAKFRAAANEAESLDEIEKILSEALGGGAYKSASPD